MTSLLLLSPHYPEATLAIGMPGMWEWIIILVIVLVIFGPGKLPMIGEALGKSIRSFKKSVDKEEEIDVTPPDQIPENTSQQNSSQTRSKEEQHTPVR